MKPWLQQKFNSIRRKDRMLVGRLAMCQSICPLVSHGPLGHRKQQGGRDYSQTPGEPSRFGSSTWSVTSGAEANRKGSPMQPMPRLT
jgi:hypothetical protein